MRAQWPWAIPIPDGLDAREAGPLLCGGVTVFVEPKPHWAEDMRAFRLDAREYCRYADWTTHGARTRFYGHIDTSGDDVMMKARAMIAREIADGFWD